MTPFSPLLTPPQIPVWHGERRMHYIDREPAQRQAKRWEPWTLITPGVALPTARVAAGCWALLTGRAG